MKSVENKFRKYRICDASFKYDFRVLNENMKGRKLQFSIEKSSGENNSSELGFGILLNYFNKLIVQK